MPREEDCHMLIEVKGNGFDAFCVNMDEMEYQDFLASVKDPSRRDEWVTLKDDYNNEHTFKLGDVTGVSVVVG